MVNLARPCVPSLGPLLRNVSVSLADVLIGSCFPVELWDFFI